MNKSSFSAYSDQISFIWCLLHLYYVKGSLDEVMNLVSSIYEQQFEFTSEFEGRLLKLWETSDAKFLLEIAKQAATQNLFDIDKHIFIVALLVENGGISINDAALLLKYDAGKNYVKFDKRIRKVIDVTWLVIEDAEDGIMSPEGDDMLADALKEVLSLYRENICYKECWEEDY